MLKVSIDAEYRVAAKLAVERMTSQTENPREAEEFKMRVNLIRHNSIIRFAALIAGRLTGADTQDFSLSAPSEEVVRWAHKRVSVYQHIFRREESHASFNNR